MLALATLASACGHATVPATTAVSGLPFQELLATSRACRPTSRRHLVLRTPEEWRQWWSEVACDRGAPPEVDFTTRVVLVVEDDAGPNGCYGARIVSVERGAAGELAITAVRQVPAPSAVCTQVVVQLAHAVSVPGPVESATVRWETRASGGAR